MKVLFIYFLITSICLNMKFNVWNLNMLVIDALPSFESIYYYVQVRGGQLWGTDVYTYDSDLVAGMCCKKVAASFLFLGTGLDVFEISTDFAFLLHSSHAYRLLSPNSFSTSHGCTRVAHNHSSATSARLYVLICIIVPWCCCVKLK